MVSLFRKDYSMNYPDVQQIRSRIEQERLYTKAVKEVSTLRKQVSAENIVAKEFKHDRDGLRDELKKTKRTVVTISKREKAAQEANKAGMWSGGAAIFVTILYEIWKVIGFPGGHAWEEFWQHEAPYGVIMWLTTLCFAQFYKATRH